VFEETEFTDLSRAFIREGLKYGIRFNLMHSISREERPEAEFPRTNVEVIGEAFDLVNTTDQDPNIKWFVVGSSGYKRSLYPQILEWGFDLVPCSPSAEKKGYPWCGTNSLYEWEPPGAEGLKNRERSDIFQYYANKKPPPPPLLDVPKTAKEAGNFGTLLALLDLAGLVETLSKAIPITVFAPTDDAFGRLPSYLVDCLVDPANMDELIQVLAYHVAPKQVLAWSLEDGQQIDTLSGQAVTVGLSSVVMINNAVVVAPDVQALNGVIHGIDRVLIPSDLDVESFCPEPPPPPSPSEDYYDFKKSKSDKKKMKKKSKHHSSHSSSSSSD